MAASWSIGRHICQYCTCVPSPQAMPPYVPRKRHHPSPPASAKSAKQTPPSTRKTSTIFDAIDARPSLPSVEENKQFLRSLEEDDKTSPSSLSDVESDEFEDVAQPHAAKRRKTTHHSSHDEEESVQDNDDEMEWEDATRAVQGNRGSPEASGDLELTLNELPTHSLGSLTQSTGKKGPTKIERQIRTNTHCMHVLTLVHHASVRNSWACDGEVERNLAASLPAGVKDAAAQWREACGRLGVEINHEDEQREKVTKTRKGKKPAKKQQSQRDWGSAAELPEESGSSGARQGDPTVRLLKLLSSYWRKRFTTTAPGLRKEGYKTIKRLEEEIRGARADPQDVDLCGERVDSLEHFQKLAKRCQGSRDVGAQLFTALLRGLGLEARLVCSLQPVGFGWSKIEDAHPPKGKKGSKQTPTDAGGTTRKPGSSKANAVKSRGAASKGARKNGVLHSDPIALSDDDEESPLSTPPSSGDESIIDVTPSASTQPSKRYDRDLVYPVFWAEVLSPITNRWIPVDPNVTQTVAATQEGFDAFEPRGAKADRAKQVLAYVVAYAADRTAKDVTVRYLKRHMWPGKTRGVRLPVEKVPVYNKHGKVKRYEDYDWFKTVMSGYERPYDKRTPADDIEEAQELRAVRVNREAKPAREDTLQGYKNSAEFVLARHLRREEALVPGAKPVRTFTSGKGDKTTSEPVHRRADVVACKTVESWHKEGREVRAGEQPLKFVPMRAVTLVRKREIEEAERESGEKQKQGLYSRAQTGWIVPPPIAGGVIPKNAFGNMDVYVPSMVPGGAVHMPLRGSAKICRKLQIDYAEACTGFEFGNRRAVPILTGVVVAKENKALLFDAWKVEEGLKRKKEEQKRQKLVLGTWKKLLTGLRIVERVRQEYGDDAGPRIAQAVDHPMAVKKKTGKGGPAARGRASMRSTKPAAAEYVDSQSEEEHGGGSKLRDDFDALAQGGGGFIADDGVAQHNGDHGGGGFLVDADESSTPRQNQGEKQSARGPISLQSLHARTESVRRPETEAESSDADEEEEEDLEPPAVPRLERKAQNSKQMGKGKAKSGARNAAGSTPTLSRRVADRQAKAATSYLDDESSDLDSPPEDDRPPEDDGAPEDDRPPEDDRAVSAKGRSSRKAQPKAQHKAPARKTPMRATAKRSGFFEHGSDSADDDGDDDDDDDDDDDY